MSGYVIWATFGCSRCRSVFASCEKGYDREVTLYTISPILLSVTNSQSAVGSPQLKMLSGMYVVHFVQGQCHGTERVVLTIIVSSSFGLPFMLLM